MTDDLEDLRRRLVVGHKRDGRSVYDEAAKAELVGLCLKRGVSVARIARECGVNANQVSRWLREHGEGRCRTAVATPHTPREAPALEAFVSVPVVAPGMSAGNDGRGMGLQARLPNGVVVELRNVDAREVGSVIEALGSLPCSISTKA